MAIKRKKKEARKIRLRTSIRKVVHKIRKAESNIDSSMPKDTFEYWYAAVSQLSLGQLQLAADHLNQSNVFSYTGCWYYKVDLFEVAKDAIMTALVEKTIGLTS